MTERDFVINYILHRSQGVQSLKHAERIVKAARALWEEINRVYPENQNGSSSSEDGA